MAELRIALAVDRTSTFGRELIIGLLPIAHRHGWMLELVDLHAPPLGRELRGRHPAGVIVMVACPAQVAACSRLGVPVVNVGQHLPGSALAHVGNDDQAIGAMAAAHLLERGRRRFIAIGDPRKRMDALRIAGFRAAGCDGVVLAPAALARSLPALLRRQPEPAGVFAVSDDLGVQALSALLRAGLAVPEAAAVVGVDNDDLSCRLARPELSSVAVARREIGAAAGEMLAALLAGTPVAPLRFIAPLTVVVRASSDHWAITDPDLAAACACIRARAHQRLGPEDVVAAVPVSRSSLQRRFREAFGQTLREAIRSAQLDRARRLLSDSDDKLAVIAHRSGFAHAAQLVHMFRQAEGMTPEAWRRRLRHS